MSSAKPTLEDIVRLARAVQVRLGKERIGLSVTIQSYPLDPPKPNPQRDEPKTTNSSNNQGRRR